jgi:hypothetical protein
VTRVGVFEAAPGQQVNVDLVGESETDDWLIRSTEIRFRTESGVSSRVQSTQGEQLCDDSVGEPVPTKYGGFHYFCFGHADGLSEETSNVSLTFEVKRAAFERWNVTPEELTWYRHDGTGWSRLESRLVSRGSVSTYHVSSPGLSVYATSAGPPAVRIIDAWIENASRNQTTVTPGTRVNINALIERAGSEARAERNVVELRIGDSGRVVAERRVRPPDRGQARTRFTHQFERPGEYELYVNDVRAGRVIVGNESQGLEESATETLRSPLIPFVLIPFAGGASALLWVRRNT